MSLKKCIAISQRLYKVTEYYELRETLSLDWGIFFRNYLSDFLMLPLSVEQDFSSYIPLIKGVILSGGNDLSIFSNHMLSKKRDKFETNVIEVCIKYSIPILGICRGAQLIAHYFESTLETCKEHIGKHDIQQGSERFVVNSYHNYGIKKLGNNLVPLAFSDDFYIESFKHELLPIYGIMWHIERDDGMINDGIFKDWINLVKDKK